MAESLAPTLESARKAAEAAAAHYANTMYVTRPKKRPADVPAEESPAIEASLSDRMVDLANRVHACAPGGHLEGPYKTPSAYGSEQDMTNWVASQVRGEQIAEKQGEMTDDLWSEVREGIEEMGRAGYKSHKLEPYLSRRPSPTDCGHLGAEIYFQASKMVTD
jgi:hypothetical protein